MAKSNSLSKTAVWVLLALLILGLAGFGASGLGGDIRTVGSVGTKSLSTQSYFMAMQRELRNVQQQTGQPLTMARAREIGLDRAVLQRLVTFRALDHEATALGLSVGDGNVRDQVLSIGAFQGLDGSFDREAYAFALEQQGLTEQDFETQLREETARTLLQSAVVNGVQMPVSFADTLVSYAGQQRSFEWAVLDASALEVELEPADEAALRAYYDENTQEFTLPLTKKITFAWLTPDMLADDVELDEDALQAAYRDRLDEFSQPERRLVERLVYLDQESADAAMASLEVAGATFESLVQERGLSLADVDLGDVGRLELDAAGEAVFSVAVGDVVGPLPSDLGPALFRVNGILPAQSVTFEEALPDLRETLALDRARRIIDGQAESYEDLLAGGATLEELAADTDMVMGEALWSRDSGDGIAAYEEFRAAAESLSAEDFPEIFQLEDGGVFAMRLEEELPERPEPFDSARADVSAAVEVARTVAALQARAEVLLPQLNDGASFADLELEGRRETNRTRGAFVPGTPPALLTEVFEMTPGAARLVEGEGRVLLVRLDDITPVADSPEADTLRSTLQSTLDQALAQDLFDIFTTDVASRAEPRIDQRAIDAINANFP